MAVWPGKNLTMPMPACISSIRCTGTTRLQDYLTIHGVINHELNILGIVTSAIFQDNRRSFTLDHSAN